MKRHLLSVLALVLVLSACKQDDGGGTPSGNLGDGDLTLGGVVYRYDDDYKPVKYTEPEIVEVRTGRGQTLGTGALTNGEFSIKITGKPTIFYSPSSFFTSFDVGDVTVNPPDAQGVEIYLETTSHKGIQKDESSYSETSGSGTSVRYLYMDRDAVITLEGATDEDGFTISGTTLSLSKGWNALYFKGNINLLNFSGSGSISVGNPDLRWIIE